MVDNLLRQRQRRLGDYHLRRPNDADADHDGDHDGDLYDDADGHGHHDRDPHDDADPHHDSDADGDADSHGDRHRDRDRDPDGDGHDRDHADLYHDALGYADYNPDADANRGTAARPQRGHGHPPATRPRLGPLGWTPACASTSKWGPTWRAAAPSSSRKRAAGCWRPGGPTRVGRTAAGFGTSTSAIPSVHVQVFFVKGDGSPPIEMTILNPAPGTNYGWLTRGKCHALEVAWPGEG